MRKRVFDITFADVSMESRNLREIAALLSAGYDVTVISSEITRPLPDIVKGADYVIYNVQDSKAKNTLLRNLLSQAKYLKSIKLGKADVVILHGFTTLLVGCVAVAGEKKKPKIVYHSHEFELARNATTKRSSLKMKFIKYIEGLLCRKSDMVIVPSQSIADRMQEIHRLKLAPIIVLSVPNKWKVDSSICEKKREEYLHFFNSTKGRLVMYHGAIMQGRGIETIIQAIALISDVFLVILGFGDDEYIASLKDLAEREGCSSRVQFQQGVAQKDLWQYIGAVDLETCLLPATCESYELALPNKLFESIQSLTPIIASNNLEIKRVVSSYNVGHVVEVLEPSNVAQCISDVLANEEILATYKKNMVTAKTELCWENESQKFIDQFSKAIRRV